MHSTKDNLQVLFEDNHLIVVNKRVGDIVQGDITGDKPLSEVVKEYTAKKGVDVILDHVGAKYLKPNMASLGYTGKLVIIGIISGIKAELNLALMMVKRQQIIGSVLRSRPVAEKGAIIAEFTRRALPKFADRTIVPIIEKVFPLAEVVEAHRMMEEDKHFGKIVLKIADA